MAFYTRGVLVCGGLATAAGLVGTVSPAYAAVPTYTCTAAVAAWEAPEVAGTSCTASNGATPLGHYEGISIIRQPDGGPMFRCTDGGVASLPSEVTGSGCAFISFT